MPHFKQVNGRLRVERGIFEGNDWKPVGAPYYSVEQSRQLLEVDLDDPQVIRISW